jgi:hypothetical protein
LITTGLLATVSLGACSGPGTYNDAVGRPNPPGTDLPAVGASPVTSPLGPASNRVPGSTTAFCRDVQQLQQLGALLIDPTGRAAGLARALAVIDRLPADAPAEVQPAATALVAAVNRLATDVRGSQPDASALPGLLQSFVLALQPVVGYASTHC